ncbi:phosphate ABC transporter permease subunit PstC [Urbifossiella limnaea]|uniref:Phosphate transport system permease protein PstA n=1 Tax=Urbifossiella limnaea TaxID=2528023 RepID=A0A517XXU3_9BACT|nr:phosphate ABC transporter permease subunit PstC [Urbifossiella limnaea]QDU22317.1 Phosphate transport system permease protein PstC [Urbifossiella limnaea]
MSPPAAPAPSSLPEVVFQGLTRAAGVGILVLVASLVAVLLHDAWPVLSRAGEYRLFTSSEWVPKPAGGGSPVYGVLAFVWGTVVTSVLAMVIAVPLGVASAAYMSEIAPPWVKKVGAFLIELLAAIPSVVYGFWGLFFLAPLIQKAFDAVGGPNTGGNGVVAAGLILAIMVLPYITAIGYDVCQAVPRSQREGSLALGATRWQTIWNVVLPYARPGIIAASFLALGRALGETMAVTMLIGNQAVIDASPFALGDSIASRIANQLNEADTPDFRSALVALGLVLFAVTAAFNVTARLLLRQLVGGPRVRRHETGDRRQETGNPNPTAASSTSDATSTEPSGSADSVLSPVPRTTPPVSRAGLWDKVMTGVLAAGLVATIVPLFLILGYITVRGASAVDATLFTEWTRAPLTDTQYEQYQAWQDNRAEYPKTETGRNVRRGGLGNAMVGSLMIVTIATLLAVPFALMAAVYLAEARRSRVAAAVRFVTELLGGVPSIVIGIFAYAVLVYPFWYPSPFGFNAWAGAFALAVMMIPIIVRSAEESMKLVPENIRQASYALGASRMQTTLRVILPAALPAIVTGVFLAVGRIAGETAPLLLTAGGSDQWPVTVDGTFPFLHARPASQTAFLPGNIFNYSRSPYADWRDQAWGGAVVLLAVVMVLNIGIRLAAGKRVVAAARAD